MKARSGILGNKNKTRARRKKILGKMYDPSNATVRIRSLRFPHFCVYYMFTPKSHRDLSMFLSVMIEFCWIIIFQVSECDCCSLQRCWKEDFLTPEQHQALDWVLSYVDQGEIVLCWMLISADIYQRNCEDMEICHNSEKNLLRGSRRN